MSLVNCAGLKEAVGNWLARPGDAQITTNVGDFIALAESHLNRNLRVRRMETTTSFTTNLGSYNLPSDYLAWRRVTSTGDPNMSLEYLVPDVLDTLQPFGAAGIPHYFTIEGENLRFRPYDDATPVELLYYARLQPLVDDEDSNWCLDFHPDLYLAATLAEANAFLINPEHATLWGQKRDTLIDELTVLSEKTKGPARMIPQGTFY